jgi:hypothetical protein
MPEKDPEAVQPLRSRWLAAAVGGVLLGTLSFGPPALAQSGSVTITLSEQNASGVSGSAVLTSLGSGRTRVEIRVTPTSGNHPAHIHMGSCADLNPQPEVPLTNVQNGTSTTDVDVDLNTLQDAQRAINLHLSPEQAATYVACGDIPVISTQPPTAPPPVARPTTAPAPPPRATGGAEQVAAPAQVPAPRNLPAAGQAGGVPVGLFGAAAALILAGIAARSRFPRRDRD